MRIEQIKSQLDSIGYYYQSSDQPSDDQSDDQSEEWGTDTQALLALGRGLGELYVPDGMSSENPIITTMPTADATLQQPFDHKNAIGWHNDFSTMAKRPKYSIFSIKQQDPRGCEFGAWGVLPGQQLVDQLRQRADGEELLGLLSTTMVPFHFDGDTDVWYPLVEFKIDNHIQQLRYYHYAISKGLNRALSLSLLSNEQTQKVKRLIDVVEATANQIGLKLIANQNSLLIVNNEICLHNRFEQSVMANPRIANLLFVK